jgi:hypothetical protein
LVPASEKMGSTARFWLAPARFLLQVEQVEDGDADGDHGEARGGPYRRRWSESGSARVSVWGEIRRGGRNPELLFVLELL